MADLGPRSVRFRRRLIVVGLGLYLLVPISLSALQLRKGLPRQALQSSASSPSPTPEPSPPAVDFQAVPDRDNAGPDDAINIAIFVANKSSKPISKLRIDINDPAFAVTKAASLPDSLPAFRSVSDTVTIKASGPSTFGARKVLLSLEYAWKAGDTGPEFVSKQPATAAVTIARRFEEEAKGFPGGTVAFLYLLLPIIPAILSYQFFEGWRKGEEWKVPSFGSDYVVPAFLFAVLINLGILLLFRYNTSLGYSNPLIFILVMSLSTIAGASVPLYRWKRDVDRRKREAAVKERWTFTDGETPASYLRKALLRPNASRKFKLAECTVGGAPWTGLYLEQPDGSKVLGAVLQVYYPNKATPDQWDYLTRQVLSETNVVLNAEQLIHMVETNELAWRHEVRIAHGAVKLDELVVIDEVQNGKWADGNASPLVIPSR